MQNQRPFQRAGSARNQQSHAVQSILHLQRTTNNTKKQVQPKLRVNLPGDIYEQEADRVANHVMQGPVSTVQRQSKSVEEEEVLSSVPTSDAKEKGVENNLNPSLESVSIRDSSELGEQKELIPIQEPVLELDDIQEEELIQPKNNNDNPTVQVTPEIEKNIHSFKGSGHPLPTSDRTFFEPRFGVTFGNVRLHTNGRAAQAAQSINSRTFTLGHKVPFVFAPSYFVSKYRIL